MKIASIVTQMPYQKQNVAKLEEIGEFIQHNTAKAETDELIDLLKDVDYLITGGSGVKYLGEEVFKQAENLKVISLLSSGVDYIDLEAAKQHGVTVCNAKGANAQSVAEHLLGMTLNLSKKISQSHRGLRDEGKNFVDYEGIELFGKTAGIIGFGEIGSRYAQMVSGMGMKVLYNSTTPKVKSEHQFADLDTLFSKSDLIAVAVPGNDETKNLISKDLLSKLKEKAIIVSISREFVINEQAILEFLESGKLFGYGFDADINEQPNPRFYDFPNVIITPHSAFFTHQSEINVEDTAVENIVKFHAGQPQNIVV